MPRKAGLIDVSSTNAPPFKLQVEGVEYRYGSTKALAGVSLAVEAGEFVSILGPSGCGKTTLLRIVAGLQRPARGRVLLDGRDITDFPPERRPLNMVFQHLALFPHLSVGANVGFGLKLKKVRPSERKERVAGMLSLVGLSGYEQRSTHQLSGGQQQRVALARALITEPEILLLDEPLGALDLAIRKDMQAELTALQRRLGISFIYVTHDQTEAMSMSDRIVLMSDGVIVQHASPVDTYLQPASPFAARFVGDTNLLQGIVIAVDDRDSRIQVERGELLLPPIEGASIGSHVALSLRPEHIHLSAEVNGAISGSIAGTTFLGSEVIIEVETALGLLRVRQPGLWAANGTTGDAIWLEFDPSHVRAFVLDDPGGGGGRAE
jgi:putative spermidine/putrescine transport system ATP-binding protein